MTKLSKKRHDQIFQQQSILEKARETLKKEFIGIDTITDEVISALSPWYLFPDLQDKPVIINLWGLTGVGKTSLVNRLSQLIGFDKKFHLFDMGDNEKRSIKSNLEHIDEAIEHQPVILAFDEFQFARTIDEVGKESTDNDSRIIWQLLDSGKFKVKTYSYLQESLMEELQKLKFLLRAGVKVSKGNVIDKHEYFLKQMGIPDKYEKWENDKFVTQLDNILFIQEDLISTIFNLTSDKYIFENDLKEKLLTLNGPESIKFMERILYRSTYYKTIDFTKSLIFIIGNLDEAYRMSQNFNPDIDADEFHEQSLKITIPIIKNALKRRFRNEQIARLGNIHIIYPALSKQAYQTIIDIELSKSADKIFSQYHIKLNFDNTIRELIYREGVYPTQGTRPIFTTIHHIINSKMGSLFIEIINKKLSITDILFKSLDENILAEFINDGSIVHAMKFNQQLALEKLRKNKRDDVQSIVAVHEAGHAILASILLNTVPEVIFSNTAEVNSGGFVFTKFKWKYVSRKEIIKRIAIMFGGIVAEKLIFGEENVTTGSERDIENATIFANEMIKQCGMGSSIGAYHVENVSTRDYLYDDSNKIGKEVEKWLKEALAIAEQTLEEQKVLLLQMADHLSDNRMLVKDQIIEMLDKYAVNFNTKNLIEDGDHIFYRANLKKKVQALKSGNVQMIFDGNYELILNKKL